MIYKSGSLFVIYMFFICIFIIFIIIFTELFYTERNHLRNLKIMHQVFYVRMLGEHWIPKELVKLLFPNLEEMITLHSK